MRNSIKNVTAAVRVAGDLKTVLAALLERTMPADHRQWTEELASLRREPHPADRGEKALPDPLAILQTLRRLTDDDTIVATDVGQHQMWTAQHFELRQPRTFLSSGGLGTMGYGLGAAIGAQFGCPHRRVVLISGDGSFHMNLNELTTLASYNLPIVVLVMNNQVLGMVRQWQKVFYGNRFSATDPHRKTDLVKPGGGLCCTGYAAGSGRGRGNCAESGAGSTVARGCGLPDLPGRQRTPMIPPREARWRNIIEEMDN